MSISFVDFRVGQQIKNCLPPSLGAELIDIIKRGDEMCECRKVAKFEISGKIFEIRYVCGIKALIVDILDKDGNHDSQVNFMNISDYLEADESSSRDELNEIIQGLNDKEIERLKGYLEGWQDSDNE